MRAQSRRIKGERGGEGGEREREGGSQDGSRPRVCVRIPWTYTREDEKERERERETQVRCDAYPSSHQHVHVNTRINIPTSTHAHQHMHINTYTSTHTHTNAFTSFVCVWGHISTRTHQHTHINTTEMQGSPIEDHGVAQSQNLFMPYIYCYDRAETSWRRPQPKPIYFIGSLGVLSIRVIRVYRGD